MAHVGQEFAFETIGLLRFAQQPFDLLFLLLNRPVFLLGARLFVEHALLFKRQLTGALGDGGFQAQALVFEPVGAPLPQQAADSQRNQAGGHLEPPCQPPWRKDLEGEAGGRRAPHALSVARFHFECVLAGRQLLVVELALGRLHPVSRDVPEPVAEQNRGFLHEGERRKTHLERVGAIRRPDADGRI